VVECDGPQDESSASTSTQADELTAKLRQQSTAVWKVIDTLKKSDLKKPELISILEENEQTVPTGLDKVSVLCLAQHSFSSLPIINCRTLNKPHGR